MSAVAARCPHCGARQARAPAPVHPPATAAAPSERPRPVLRDVTPEEARAILAAHTAMRGPDAALEDPPGIFAALLLPSAYASAGARLAEVALTLVALPLLACSMLGAALAWRTLRRMQSRAGAGAAGARLAALASGSMVLWWLAGLARFGEGARWILLGVSWGALLVRGVVRARARSATRPDLLR